MDNLLNQGLIEYTYAGGSSITFNDWSKKFYPELDCIVVDYAGHGNRRELDLYKNIGEACEDLYQIIKKTVPEYDGYYFCGHCIGAIIADELYYCIKEKHEIDLPKALFISGQGAPDKINDDGLWSMDSHELLNYLYNLGVIADEMMDKDLFSYVEDMVVSLVKSGSGLCKEYICNLDRNKVKCNVYVMYGNEDTSYSEEEIRNWENFANEAEFIEFNGGHYFVNDCADDYIDEIKDVLDL